MIWWALGIVIGCLVMIFFPPFTWLSLVLALTDLPRRISDYFCERTERRERQRIARARAQIVLVGRKSSGQKG